MKALDTSTQQRFITKWSSNNMGTGHKLVQWRYRHKGNCPYCMQQNKDVPHILQCHNELSIRQWNESLWDLITRLYKINTCRNAIIAIMKELASGCVAAVDVVLGSEAGGLVRVGSICFKQMDFHLFASGVGCE
jgi:hypothetical protein